MYKRLYSFLNIHSCLTDLQFGFRANHSTSHALISITEKIRDALDNDNFACGVFIDLKKAFDTVDHNILIAKLEYYGARNISKNWFSSYLQNRSQFVTLSGYESSSRYVQVGVPQGSVLGPLLFLIYINDLNISVKNSIVHHFADDTNLLYINKSIKVISKKINYDLKGITNWLNANRISLNISKTEFIIFRKRSKPVCSESLKIKINGVRLYPSTSIKYLGILIDEHLSWKYHICELVKKLNRSNNMLSKIRHYVNSKTIRSLYFSLFSSHISYCHQIWGQNGGRYLNKIISLQRSAVRIINFMPFRSDVSRTFDRSKIPKFINLVRTSNLLFVYDCLSFNSPSSLKTFFSFNKNVHDYNTRSSETYKLTLPRFKSMKYGKNAIKYQCITEWNKSIDDLITCFKIKYVNFHHYNNIFDLNRNQFKRLILNYIGS